MKQRKVIKIKGEKFLFRATLVLIGLFFAMNFVSNAVLQTKNAELQRLKSKIESQEKNNLGMQMKINELASLDNALNVASAYGLEYNNGNIKVISE